MSIVFLLSVILKGLGAVLEVLLQVMITRMLGLAGYGTYSTWVSAADLVYWVLFSGITKCNTFYLSNKGTELRRFKGKILQLLCAASPDDISVGTGIGKRTGRLHGHSTDYRDGTSGNGP